MTGRRFLIALLAIGALALAWRVAYVFVETRHQEFPGSVEGARRSEVGRSYDELYYVGTAKQVADGNGFRRQPFFGPADVEAADHPPLTGLVLAPVALLFDGSELAMRLTMAVLGTVVVLLVGLTARQLAGPVAGLVAAGIATIYPAFWMNDGLLMAETVAAVTTTAAILLLVHLLAAPSWPRAAAVGAMCGLAMLARGELALLVPVACLAILLSLGDTLVRRIAVAGAVGGAAAIVVLPWVAYNMSRFDEPVFLSTGDGGVLSGANCDDTYYGPFTGFWIGLCGGDFEGSDWSVVSLQQREKAFRYIGNHQTRVPAVVAARVGRAWGFYRPLHTAEINQAEGRPKWASLLGYASLLILVPAAVLGARGLRRRGLPLVPLLGPLVVGLLVVAAFYGNPRFRITGEASLVVLAAVGIVDHLPGRERATGGRRPPTTPAWRRLTTWRAGTRRCLVRPVEVSYIHSRGDRVQFSLSGERNANVHVDDVASDLQTTHRAYYGDCACYSPWWALPK